MKKEYVYKVSDFTEKLDRDTVINIYDADGYSENFSVKDLTKALLTKPVIKFKQDRADPGLHFKIAANEP